MVVDFEFLDDDSDLHDDWTGNTDLKSSPINDTSQRSSQTSPTSTGIETIVPRGSSSVVNPPEQPVSGGLTHFSNRSYVSPIIGDKATHRTQSTFTAQKEDSERTSRWGIHWNGSRTRDKRYSTAGEVYCSTALVDESKLSDTQRQVRFIAARHSWTIEKRYSTADENVSITFFFFNKLIEEPEEYYRQMWNTEH